MKTIYIILSTSVVGGAEKRFLELWLHMQECSNCNIYLVLSQELFHKLTSNNSQFTEVEQHIAKVIFWDFGNLYLDKRRNMKSFMKKYHTTNAVFHFILTFPIMIGTYYNTILTYPSTAINHMNMKGRIITYLSFLEAKKIDILDPSIYKRMRKYFFWKKESFVNTPGSFIDTAYYRSISIKDKKNWLVFLGRFEEEKQILEFIKSIPYINNQLEKIGVKNIKFFVLGNGTLEEDVKSTIQSKKYENIDLQVYFEDEPINILKYSKVFFSLQKYTNYPSKSLLEAIACKNIPIVTDNRDTRLIANEDFSFYVSESFSKQDLSNVCQNVFELSDDDYEKKTNKGIQFIKDNFSIENSIKYYLDIYGGKIS